MAKLTFVRITHQGQSVEVPLEGIELRLVKKMPYWRAYFFRIGQGIPMELVSRKEIGLATLEEYECEVLKPTPKT